MACACNYSAFTGGSVDFSLFTSTTYKRDNKHEKRLEPFQSKYEPVAQCCSTTQLGLGNLTITKGVGNPGIFFKNYIHLTY